MGKRKRRTRCPACGRLGEERRYTNGDRAYLHDKAAVAVYRDHCYIRASLTRQVPQP